MSQDLLIRCVAGGMLLVGFFVAGFWRKRATAAHAETFDRRKEEGLGLMIGLRGVALALIVVACATLFGAEWIRPTLEDLPLAVRWTGIAVMIAALPLMLWVMSHLGHNITSTVAIRRKHTLVTSGPYRWVRHPLYLAGTMVWAGVALATGSWAIAGVWGVAYVLLWIRTGLEEERLIGRFGDAYRDYMKRTGRFVPRFSASCPACGPGPS